MAASLGASQLKVSLWRENLVGVARVRSWKGEAIQRGLEPRSRGLATVRNRYHETSSDDTAGWKRLNVCVCVCNSDL
jgi:hypothetical protein